ncbi:Uncharacterized protein FKW44_011352, partial [Caligus rogercresseyi]
RGLLHYKGYSTKHPAQTMVLGVVASDGKKMPSFFFKAVEKIHKDTYYKVLRYTVLPWLKANYPEGNYVWTQDSAPLHSSDLCQKFCTANMAHFGRRTVALLLAGSEPVGLRHTNRTPHPNVDALKATIRTEWDNMSEEFLINSCKTFRRRVELSLKLKEATSSESAHRGPAFKFC